MAVANTKSTIVTNADATPVTRTPAKVMHGRLREQRATVETAAADDAGSVYRLMRVHSSWVVSQLLVGHDAITNMSTADIGLYKTAADGGAVVDVDFFDYSVDMSSASSGMVDRTYGRTNARISDIEKPLWEQLALTSDPNIFYDIAVTATTNDPTAAVSIAAIVRYSDNT